MAGFEVNNSAPAAAKSQLALRTIVGLALATLAIGAVYAGGFAFGALATLAVLLMYTEWVQLFRLDRGWRLIGMTALAIAMAMAEIGQALLAIAVLATGAGVLMLGARPYIGKASSWLGAGLLYSGLPGIALIWMRGLDDGFALTLLTLACVWATDIAAYFTGRSLGGPKLAPAISPNKTWSGLLGGMAGAALTAYLLVKYLPGLPLWLASIGAGLAVAAQGGDLFESWLKRRLGVKDSGTLLPGHGGVLDRLDGLVPVAVLLAATVAVLHVGGAQ